jgi:hypothetical protein
MDLIGLPSTVFAAYNYWAPEADTVWPFNQHNGATRSRRVKRSASSTAACANRVVVSALEGESSQSLNGHAAPVEGLMQDYPLTLHHVLWRIERCLASGRS